MTRSERLLTIVDVGALSLFCGLVRLARVVAHLARHGHHPQWLWAPGRLTRTGFVCGVCTRETVCFSCGREVESYQDLGRCRGCTSTDSPELARGDQYRYETEAAA